MSVESEEREQPELGWIAMSKTSYERALDRETLDDDEDEEQGLLAQARAGLEPSNSFELDGSAQGGLLVVHLT